MGYNRCWKETVLGSEVSEGGGSRPSERRNPKLGAAGSGLRTSLGFIFSCFGLNGLDRRGEALDSIPRFAVGNSRASQATRPPTQEIGELYRGELYLEIRRTASPAWDFARAPNWATPSANARCRRSRRCRRCRRSRAFVTPKLTLFLDQRPSSV
jgi:hypothetical protein